MTGPVEMDIPVRWGEMDALGHVNNTVFFRWFEDVRIATFEQVGICWDGPSEMGPILATTRADFLAPVRFPSSVRVSCTIGDLGRTSFTMEYRAEVSGEPVASGSAVVVMIDYSTGQKVPLPPALRERLTSIR